MFAPRGWLKRPVARRIYRTIASSDLFDARWYRSTQVSGLGKLIDPLWHYLDYGARDGLDPSPRFDSSHYVHAHHDVRNSGLNPLFHYLEYGIQERRSPLRSATGTRDVLLPETAELESFTSPKTSSPRVTLVADSRSEPESSRSLAEIVQAAHKFAQKNSRTLRVIAWPGSGGPHHHIIARRHGNRSKTITPSAHIRCSLRRIFHRHLNNVGPLATTCRASLSPMEPDLTEEHHLCSLEIASVFESLAR